MTLSFDVIVIGGGPGGYVAAIRAAQLGQKTAVVERDKAGGRCLNYACIPAKTILRSAEIYDEAKNGAELGIVGDVSIDWPALQARRGKVSESLSGGVKFLWDKNKITMIEGEGSLTAEGDAGLRDRSSAPRRRPSRLPADRPEAIEALRRLRMTAAEIAEVLDMALSTVSRWLRRIGLGRRSRLEPPEPPNRYERKRPGKPIHVDVKKLDRIGARGAGHRVTGNRRGQLKVSREGRQRRATGWEFVHVCVDDATRLAYVEVLADEKGATAAGFLRRAVAWFRSMGITVERVLSDNGACYRSRLHARACAELGVRHLFTRPYRPQTNGKAERFIQTMRNRWAYGAIYGSSAERTAALPGWLDHYNFRRGYGSLGHRPPAARLAELEQPRE